MKKALKVKEKLATDLIGIILFEQNCRPNQCLLPFHRHFATSGFIQELRDFVSDGDTGWKVLRGNVLGGRDATFSSATTSTLPYPYKANVVDANGLPPVRSNLNSGRAFKPMLPL